MFSFGIVLCEVGPGAGGSWHEAWWLPSTPCTAGLQVEVCRGPRLGGGRGGLLGTGLPTAACTPPGGVLAGQEPDQVVPSPRDSLPPTTLANCCALCGTDHWAGECGP